MIREAFAVHLLGTPAFAYGVDQLDAVGVDDAEHGRGGHEELWPGLMRREEAKKPGALGELRKQRVLITRHPAIEGPVPPTFEGMQEPHSDDLTGPEVRLGVFGEACQLVINLTE